MMTSLLNIVIWPPDVDGIKFFDKDDQAAIHCSFYFSFATWLLLFSWYHQHQEALSTLNSNVFYNEVTMVKLLNLSKAGGLGSSFCFHIFFSKAFLVFGWSFFASGMFWFRHTHSYYWSTLSTKSNKWYVKDL